ncbi:MAG TPA: hypothetical protein VGN26_02345 [Armatimonadota bacterium]|jgi:hypothetical protein
MEEPPLIPAPVILDYRGDLWVFPSASDAQDWAEPVDARNGEFTAYDREGRLLSVSWDARRVYLGPGEESPEHRAALAAGLRHFLESCGDPLARQPDVPLDDLVTAASDLFMAKPRARWSGGMGALRWAQRLLGGRRRG